MITIAPRPEALKLFQESGLKCCEPDEFELWLEGAIHVSAVRYKMPQDITFWFCRDCTGEFQQESEQKGTCIWADQREQREHKAEIQRQSVERQKLGLSKQYRKSPPAA